MKKTIVSCLVTAACAIALAEIPPAFTGDYDAALARAAKENKPVFAVFSGSDWCPPCMALERDFLSKPAFAKAVTNDLVLLFVDHPRDKSHMSEKSQRLNPSLFRKYEIRGVPTLMFLDAKGMKIGEASCQNMAPDEWGRFLVDQAKKSAKPAK